MTKAFFYLYVNDGNGYPETQHFKSVESARIQAQKELKNFKSKESNRMRMIEMYIGRSIFKDNHMDDDLENPIDTIIE